MAEFPSAPVAPGEFFEQWLPRAFAEAELPPEARQVQAQLGVQLDGDGGGEWVFEVKNGAMAVQSAPREDTAFTVVQSVADWRGCLWEGRGGAIGKQAATLFRPGAGGAAQPRPGQMGQIGGPPSPAALEQMRKLDGVIKMVVTGGEGGDWAVAFKLGPGPIPAEPTATLSLTAEDAAAMESGELDPMQAFMSGRILVTGDMTIVMQMQAIQMQAAAATQAAAGGGGTGGSGGSA
jgi:putative sterol carrier protein